MGKNPITKVNRRDRSRENLFFVFCFLFFTVWLFLIRPAWLGQLGGTFKTRQVPEEYIELKDFLHRQPEFFRTFWVPQKQRFGFSSSNHPAISSMNFLKAASSSAVIDWLNKKGSQEQLSRWAVKYIIIPYDSEGEIFLEDREYSDNKEQITKNRVREIKWLKEIKGFGRIAVFEMPEYKDHFWIEDGLHVTGYMLREGIDWQMVNPTKYEVEVENADQPFNLVFSEKFDGRWAAKIKKQITDNKEQITREVYSQRTEDGLNSFFINQLGDDGKIEIEFEAQKYVNYGLIISGVTLFGAIGGLAWLKLKH